MAFCRQLKSQSTRLSDIVYDGDPVVIEFIAQGIDAANAEVTSDSAKIVKWTILETDFSVVGGELGEQARAREGVLARPLAPKALGCSLRRRPSPGPGSLASAFSTSTYLRGIWQAVPRGGPHAGWAQGTWGQAPLRPQGRPDSVRPRPAGVGGRPRLRRDSVSGATTKLKRANVAKIYQPEIERFYAENEEL